MRGTTAPTRHGFVCYRLARDCSGVMARSLCTFIARVSRVWLNEDGSKHYEITARSTRRGFDDREITFEASERTLQTRRQFDRALLSAGGVGFTIWPDCGAATIRATLGTTSAEYSDVCAELDARQSARR